MTACSIQLSRVIFRRHTEHTREFKSTAKSRRIISNTNPSTHPITRHKKTHEAADYSVSSILPGSAQTNNQFTGEQSQQSTAPISRAANTTLTQFPRRFSKASVPLSIIITITLPFVVVVQAESSGRKKSSSYPPTLDNSLGPNRPSYVVDRFNPSKGLAHLPLINTSLPPPHPTIHSG